MVSTPSTSLQSRAISVARMSSPFSDSSVRARKRSAPPSAANFCRTNAIESGADCTAPAGARDTPRSVGRESVGTRFMSSTARLTRRGRAPVSFRGDQAAHGVDHLRDRNIDETVAHLAVRAAVEPARTTRMVRHYYARAHSPRPPFKLATRTEEHNRRCAHGGRDMHRRRIDADETLRARGQRGERLQAQAAGQIHDRPTRGGENRARKLQLALIRRGGNHDLLDARDQLRNQRRVLVDFPTFEEPTRGRMQVNELAPRESGLG